MNSLKRTFRWGPATLGLLTLAAIFVLNVSLWGAGETKSLKQRSEIADKYKWRLSDIYSNSAD